MDCNNDGKKKSRSIVCGECEEEFNKSYYLQIMAEYKLLSDRDKSLNPAASVVIDDISKSVETGHHPTCDDVFSLEKALIQLQPLEKIRLERDSYRDKYREIVGPDRFANYLAEAQRMGKVAKDDELQVVRESLLSDVNFLLKELHLKYTLMPFRENQRKPILKHIGFSIIIFYLLIFILALIQVYDGIVFILLLMAFGSTGAFISLVQRLNNVPIFNDPVVNFLSLKYGRYSINVAPACGAIFAVLLYFLFLGGMIQGALFPDIDIKVEAFYITPPVSGLENFAKLFVWAFIAGFAERFVPDTLDRLIAQKEKNTATASTEPAKLKPAT